MEDQFHKKHILDVKQGFYYSFNALSSSPTYNYSQQNSRRQFVLDCTNKQKSKMNVYNPLHDRYLQYRIVHFKNLKKFKEKIQLYDKENKIHRKIDQVNTSSDKKNQNCNSYQTVLLNNNRNLQHVYGKQLQKKQFDDFIHKKKQLIQKKLLCLTQQQNSQNEIYSQQKRLQGQQIQEMHKNYNYQTQKKFSKNSQTHQCVNENRGLFTTKQKQEQLQNKKQQKEGQEDYDKIDVTE